MTDPAQIFRPEALRSRNAPPPKARTTSSTPRWIAVAYWALLALAAAGLAAGLLIRVGNAPHSSQPLIVALVTGLVSGTGGG
jgi:hypothetical protein